MLPRLLLVGTLVGFVTPHDGIAINPLLGEGGFPDCHQTVPVEQLVPAEGANFGTLQCDQKKDTDDQILVGCVGDSITAGVCSTGGNHTYPGQLQIMLDSKYPGKYKVTNMGACGSTMMKGADSPFWKRAQYKTLTSAKWDVIIIMLGTNDAKDAGSHGPHNWPHDCTSPGDAQKADLSCPFAQDYASMVSLVRTLGTTAAGPKIYTAVPPPLMQQGVYGMNQTVINDVFPTIVPAIAAANKADGVIDVFSALGGSTGWRKAFPPKCDKTSSFAPCANWCDDQSCDQCHPDNDGYVKLAAAMMKGIGL